MLIKRDGFIDFWKGLMILWVIHIHTVFWSGMGYISDLLRESSLIIDISIFFFLSGYLAKPTGFLPSAKKCAKQFITLYSNYLAFSFLLLFPLSLLLILKDKVFPDFGLAIFSMLKVVPSGELWKDLSVYPGSLWYITVFLSLLAIVPFLSFCFTSRISRISTLTSILLIFYSARYLNLNFYFLFDNAVYVSFYLFIYASGMAYRLEEANIKTLHLKISFLVNVIICTLLLLLIFHGTDVFSLQRLKFPPSFEYLFFSYLIIHMFALSKRIWRYPITNQSNRFLQFLEFCGNNIFYIYLIQGVVCSLPSLFVARLLPHLSNLGTYLFVLSFNIFFTLFLTVIYMRARNTSLSFCSRLFHFEQVAD